MESRAVLDRLPVIVPFVGVAVLAGSWGASPAPLMAAAIGVVLAGAVLVAVVHAEEIAHRVGEPFGTLVLAVAVTVIEVALIVTLMVTEGATSSSLARDTVFAAIMIVGNGIIGICLLIAARSHHTVRFSEQGAHALLGSVVTLATLSLVMPSFTSSSSGATFSGSQLAFSAVASAVVYGMFVFVQTGRHRSMFLRPDAPERGAEIAAEIDGEPAPEPYPPPVSDGAVHRTGDGSLLRHGGLLLLSLVVVVGLAKTLAPSIEEAIRAAGAPPSFVGVVIALLVLLPESIAAFRAAARGEVQTSINLALGSALASIGLTIPAIAVASIWLDGPITLGLGGKEIVLLVLTAGISMLTFGSGRATVLHATHHLAVFASFIFLAIVP